jgi:hypothetical protein
MGVVGVESLDCHADCMQLTDVKLTNRTDSHHPALCLLTCRL